MSEIYTQSIVPTYTKSYLDSISSKQKTFKHKHLLDEYNSQDILDTYEHECSMHKIQKLDESALQFQPQSEFDFDVQSFLENFDEIAFAAKLSTSTDDITVCTKTEKTLAELNRICDEPIKKTTVEDEKIIEKEIQQIAGELKDLTRASPHSYVPKTFEKTEAILIDNLKILFNSLVFTSYDFSKGGFNPKREVILYEQLYKVNVHINKTLTREFTIYFGFPFYLSLHINILGQILIARNDVYNKLEQSEEIEKIHCNAPNTGFNILDVITAAKFIRLITSKYFSSGFDLVSSLIHTMEKYKANSVTLHFNKIKINFEQFVKLYKQLIRLVVVIPIYNS